MPIFLLMMTIIALLVGVARYLVGAIMRIAHPNIGIIKDYSYKPSLSILLPAFNEGRAVYSTVESILQSDYTGKIDLIVTDDCSADDTAVWLAKAAADFPGVRAFYNKPNLGKTQTILNALAHSTSEIVMIVDSDTTLGPTCITEMMACLGDKRLGGVGAPAIVRNPNDNALTAFQVFIYFLGFQLYKQPENAMRMVGVIGGYAFALRRAAFEQLRPELENRNWFGVQVRDGEDRFITHCLLLNGHGTYMDEKAICYTAVPNTFAKYWGQQLRWRRTTIRDFFFSLRRIPEHVNKLGVKSLYVYILTPLVLFISILQVAMLFAGYPGGWLDPNRALMFFAYGFLVFMLVRRFTPSQTVKHPLKLLVYATWWIVNSLLLAPLALFTLDSGDWGNRTIKKSAPRRTIQ